MYFFILKFLLYTLYNVQPVQELNAFEQSQSINDLHIKLNWIFDLKIIQNSDLEQASRKRGEINNQLKQTSNKWLFTVVCDLWYRLYLIQRYL